VHPEVEELRPKLKEILYDCAVDIRATKAALYLFNGSRFELVTEYGFKGGVRHVADFNDPVIDRAGRGRNAFVINGMAAEPRFSELLYESSTDRLLAAPLYLRGQLIGVIDMRDKAAKAPFDQTDVPKALKIAERIAALFDKKNVFGQRFITLSEADANDTTHGVEDVNTPVAASVRPTAPAPAARPAPAAAPMPAPAPAAAPLAQARAAVKPPPQQHRTTSLASIILEARTQIDRMNVAAPPEVLTEAEVSAAADGLRSILLIPGAVAAVFSAFGHLGGVQEIAARTSINDDAKNLLQSKLNVWLSKRDESSGYVRTNVTTPFGTSTAAITAADLQKVFTAPLAIGSLRGIYLTVAFAGVPDRTAHELLAVLHAHLQLVLEQSMQRSAACASRLRAAEKLLEPDFTKYAHLRRHSEAVAKLSENFARFLAWPQSDIDDARIVGIVHDAGMRLLDYERLYRKREISQEELGILREHPVVGAAIVEPFLGSAVARAVLAHHERVDGRGYPNELRGEDIPQLSRLLQICDAYVAITDPDSYQPPETHDDGVSAISRGAATQFDEELSRRFIEFMRTQPRGG